MVGASNAKQVRIEFLNIPIILILYSLFAQGDEIGPRMLARIAKSTGLNPEDL